MAHPISISDLRYWYVAIAPQNGKTRVYEDAVQAKDGVDRVSDFLGYWFIKKATWASKSSIKANATSLKKFYSFLQEIGLIDKDDLNSLKETISEEMSEWLETLERYDDPSIEDLSDVWGF